ncbi:STAS domain-containing protein [Nocardia sp. NPDC050175]|uniref:STAS domain-containing protein n=1 Tax=Nocardia sp. NPDC050175 TaxID=3364317 RepID=UPI00378E8327
MQAEPARPADRVPAISPDSTRLRTFSTSRPPGLRCVGQIDLSTHDAWETALAELPGTPDIHLELSELTFIDTHGTLILMEATNQAAQGRRVVLHNPPETLVRILELFWPSLPTIEVDRA